MIIIPRKIKLNLAINHIKTRSGLQIVNQPVYIHGYTMKNQICKSGDLCFFPLTSGVGYPPNPVYFPNVFLKLRFFRRFRQLKKGRNFHEVGLALQQNRTRSKVWAAGKSCWFALLFFFFFCSVWHVLVMKPLWGFCASGLDLGHLSLFFLFPFAGCFV